MQLHVLLDKYSQLHHVWSSNFKGVDHGIRLKGGVMQLVIENCPYKLMTQPKAICIQDHKHKTGGSQDCRERPLLEKIIMNKGDSKNFLILHLTDFTNL